MRHVDVIRCAQRAATGTASERAFRGVDDESLLATIRATSWAPRISGALRAEAKRRNLV